MKTFIDRHAAGKELAEKLKKFKNAKDTIVLALPRGGVPVAYEIAKNLNLPLDVLVVKKLGVPWHEELAFGAITANTFVLNHALLKQLNLSQPVIEDIIAKKKIELATNEKRYRTSLPPLSLHNKTILLIDDGIATGATMMAAIEALQQQKAKNIVVATPVAEVSTTQKIKQQAHEFVCLLIPDELDAVGKWYQDFSQTSDEEVNALLKKKER